MTDAAVRVTAAQVKAITDAIAQGVRDALELATAVVTAEDSKTRYAVVTRDPAGGYAVFGPYATKETAIKVIDTGCLASRDNTRGVVLPLHSAPKKEKK